MRQQVGVPHVWGTPQAYARGGEKKRGMRGPATVRSRGIKWESFQVNGAQCVQNPMFFIRGSTLIALGQPERALPDLQRSVELSKAAVASGANQAEQTLASRTQSQRNLEQSRVTSGDLGRRRSSRCSGAARRCTRSAGGRRPRPTTAPWSVNRPATCSPFGCGGDRLGPSARPRRPTDRPPASRIGTGSSFFRWAGRRTRSASCGASPQSSTSSQSASSPSMPRRTPRAASAALPRRSGCGVSRPAR